MLTAGRLSIAGGGRRREKLLLLVVPAFNEPSGIRRGAVNGAVVDAVVAPLLPLVGWAVTTATKCAVVVMDGVTIVGVLRCSDDDDEDVGSGGGGCAGMT